jgi:hypothetical protein
MIVTGAQLIHDFLSFSHRSSVVVFCIGDHPKTAEAIAHKINLMIGDTKETLRVKTGRPTETIYDNEISAVVVHGDDIDSLEGWQWDLSRPRASLPLHVMMILTSSSLREARDRVCTDIEPCQGSNLSYQLNVPRLLGTSLECKCFPLSIIVMFNLALQDW